MGFLKYFRNSVLIIIRQELCTLLKKYNFNQYILINLEIITITL